ncbi:MAG: MarR family winged helix-turn-helix transcriptional regulator [Allobranchiibius sp.]
MDFEQAAAVNTAIRSIGIRHRALADALLAPLGLHTGQEVILLELAAQGPRTQGQLAVSSGCEPPTITGSVRKLEAAGLVVRRPSPTDGRVTIVELSDRGQALLPRLKSAWQQLAEQTVAGLTSTPVDQLADALADVAASLTAVGSPASEPTPAWHR